jgi:L-asparagine transporter-like permease
MLRAQGVWSVVVVVGAAALMCVFMYIIFCDTRAPKQQQVEKSFLPLLTLDCHYSLGSLFMFFVILFFLSLSLSSSRLLRFRPPGTSAQWNNLTSSRGGEIGS